MTAVTLNLAAPVAGNVINLTVNGIAVDPVPWDTDAATTVRRLAEAVDQNEAVRALGIDAFQVDGSPLSVYLQSPGIPITASGTITGGASPGSIASEAYTAMRFVGVARHQERSFREGAGFYPPRQPVSVLTYGAIVLPVVSSARPGALKPAYIITSGDDAGKFTDAAGGNYDSGGIFKSGLLEAGLALLEVRGAH